MRRDFPALDGLRALAVASVMIGHLVPIDWLQKAVGWGDTGVVLFFCLSGFLITDILVTARDSGAQRRGRNLLMFYGRRFLRIFPIYYLTLGVALLVGCSSVWSNFARLATYSVGVPGLPHVSLGSAAHLWSLSVEEQFYCAWPLLVFFVPRRWLLATAAGMAVVCLAAKFVLLRGGADYGTLFRPLSGCLDSLGLGATAAILRHDAPAISRMITARLFWFSLGVLGVTAVGRLVLPIDPWFQGYLLTGVCQFMVSAVAFTVAIIYVTEQPDSGPARVLGLPPMRFVARISYGRYLYHFFTPPILRELSVQWLLAGHTFNMTHTEYLTGFAIASIALSFLLALASWRYVESPLLRYKARLHYG